MLIRELSENESLTLLTGLRLGRLACAKGAQPYITPFYFVPSSNYLYSFGTVGQRIEWMRENPLVCVEADRIVSPQEWMSVIILGHFEEMPDTEEWRQQRAMTHELLQGRPMWWEPGYAKTIVHGTERPMDPIYFRIQIAEITGRRGIPDSAEVT
jgi:nitroimidazol reductase NimA-like FMN-containing flavoprotein (pyridoxamine 5'-phosphate oxidase superfamily)